MQKLLSLGMLLFLAMTSSASGAALQRTAQVKPGESVAAYGCKVHPKPASLSGSVTPDEAERAPDEASPSSGGSSPVSGSRTKITASLSGHLAASSSSLNGSDMSGEYVSLRSAGQDADDRPCCATDCCARVLCSRRTGIVCVIVVLGTLFVLKCHQAGAF